MLSTTAVAVVRSTQGSIMIVSMKHRALVLRVRDKLRVTNVIPHTKTLVWKGQELLVVPHREDEVRVLRNLGFEVPEPILHHYNWTGRYKPYAHQSLTAAFLTMNKRSFCLNGMGSGKSLAALWAYDHLRNRKLTAKLLIVAPLSTLQRTWGDTFFEHFPHLKYTVLHGDKKKRIALLKGDFDVFIINHDGIKVLYDELVASGIKHIIIDELASFRSPKSDRSKAMHTLCKDAEYVWGLTGTPTPNAPTDAWMQCKIINDAFIPKWVGKFKDMVMTQISQYKSLAKPDAMDTVNRVMQPSIRFAREDCIDLPPTVFDTREVELTAGQKIAYAEMQKEFSTGEGSQQITAVNAGVKLFKLVQIACGAAYATDGSIAKIDAASRLAAVDEIVEQAEGKVIIFVPFTAALHIVAEHIRKYTTVEVINGSVSITERNRIFGAFQNSRTAPRVIVANPGAMSHGLTLTEANTIIWYAPITSHEIYDQANHRIIRPGQTRSQLIVMLEGTPVERKIYAGLRSKKSMQDVLLNLARG